MPLKTWIILVSVTALLSVVTFAYEYRQRQITLRTHPHHWYIVELMRTRIVGVEGPYMSREDCEQHRKAKHTAFIGVTCQEMVDRDH